MKISFTTEFKALGSEGAFKIIVWKGAVYQNKTWNLMIAVVQKIKPIKKILIKAFIFVF